MSQPYPAAPAAPSAPERRQPPASVTTAVRLMYAGAVVTAFSVVVTLLTISAFRNALQQAHPNFTAAQLRTFVDAAILFDVVTDVIYVAAWVGMALACRAGRGWARIVGTMLFAFYTVSMGLSFAGSSGAGGHLLTIAVSVLVWLIGLATVVQLWRRESSEFFSASAR